MKIWNEFYIKKLFYMHIFYGYKKDIINYDIFTIS